MNSLDTFDLIKASYCISCDHLKKLNEDYKKYNNDFIKKQFTCLNKNKENYNYNTRFYDGYNQSYISKKTCYDPSLNPRDDRLWELLFNSLVNDYDNNNINFNQNTRRKTKLG